MSKYRIKDEDLTPQQRKRREYNSRPENRERRARQARERRALEKVENELMMQTEKGRETLEALRLKERERNHQYYLRNMERIKKYNLEYYHKHKILKKK